MKITKDKNIFSSWNMLNMITFKRIASIKVQDWNLVQDGKLNTWCITGLRNYQTNFERLLSRSENRVYLTVKPQQNPLHRIHTEQSCWELKKRDSQWSSHLNLLCLESSSIDIYTRPQSNELKEGFRIPSSFKHPSLFCI